MNQMNISLDGQLLKELQKKLDLKGLDKNSKNLYYSKNMELGKGAFGEVFLGYAQIEQRPFACKIISFSKLQDNPESLMKKIKEEIVNMQIAKNERIVELYQTKMSPNHIYILCEYCNGENMQIYLRNRSYLTETEAINFFKEILQGFYQLRERNIVHRDMKLANLLLHDYSIKIADLGFSKSIQNHEQLLESIVGSPAYMSPQILYKEKYTEKTDIWSLGIILYQLLYGHNPFSGCVNILQLKESIKKEIPFPEYPYVSEKTKETMKKMLKVQQQDRISWQLLFTKYLDNQQSKHNQQTEQHQTNNKGTYSMPFQLYNYFRQSYFIESYLHLNKVLPTLAIYTKQQLKSSLPSYQNKIQFFLQYKYMNENKQDMSNHFNHYLQYRNEISYLIILSQKVSKTISQCNNLYYMTYVYCLILLIYKHTISIVQDLMNKEIKVDLQNTKIKQYFEHLLTQLLKIDKDILLKEYQGFYQSFFMPFMTNLERINNELYLMVQDDLSGIYDNSKGDSRVIRFFLINYMKKVFNFLKEIISKEQNEANDGKEEELMIPEDEVENEILEKSDMHRFPSNQFTVVRLINQYISNEMLFNLRVQEANKRLTSHSMGCFRKNLNQTLFDFQNIVSTKQYEEISFNPPYKEQSINELINKEFKWNSFFFNKLL